MVANVTPIRKRKDSAALSVECASVPARARASPSVSIHCHTFAHANGLSRTQRAQVARNWYATARETVKLWDASRVSWSKRGTLYVPFKLRPRSVRRGELSARWALAIDHLEEAIARGELHDDSPMLDPAARCILSMLFYGAHIGVDTCKREIAGTCAKLEAWLSALGVRDVDAFTLLDRFVRAK
jgi:hypothetical protein